MKTTTDFFDNSTAYFHLPGLYEFYELYKVFLPLFREHREFFYDKCEIGSIYGSPTDCLWGGGRIEQAGCDTREVLALLREYDISARLTFSNSLITKEHLSDKNCNTLCRDFSTGDGPQNGIIICSDMLLEYIKINYPKFYFVSSTTKVITDFELLRKELERCDFSYVVPDFRFNKSFDKLNTLSENEKNKIELLCNECCYIGCTDRKACYEAVSRKNLGESDTDFVCTAPGSADSYMFSKAMANPAFIAADDIFETYLPMGINNFKIEGRSLGSALILEFLLYYMTKPEYRLRVRELIYLDNTLDLF